MFAIFILKMKGAQRPSCLVASIVREAVWGKRIVAIIHPVWKMVIAAVAPVPIRIVAIRIVAVAAKVRRIKAAHIRTERSNHGMRLLFMS